VDGRIHLKKEVNVKDFNRDTFLRNNGIHVLRFTNDEILNNIEQIVEKIKTRIENEIT
jgi:guanylate kinase